MTYTHRCVSRNPVSRFPGWVAWSGPGCYRLTTVGGSFVVNLYAYPNPVTGGDHLLTYRPDRIGD